MRVGVADSSLEFEEANVDWRHGSSEVQDIVVALDRLILLLFFRLAETSRFCPFILLRFVG